MASLKTMAAHIQNDDNHAVCIGSLRVIVQEDTDGWFAQGVEIDYAACGESLEDVQRRFEDGLAATVHRHLERFESIEGLLKYAPKDVIDSLTTAEFAFDMVTIHNLSDAAPLPFQRIAYLEQARA